MLRPSICHETTNCVGALRKDLPRVIFPVISYKLRCFFGTMFRYKDTISNFQIILQFCYSTISGFIFPVEWSAVALDCGASNDKEEEKVVLFCFPPSLWRLHNAQTLFPVASAKKQKGKEKKNSHSLPGSVPCTVLRLTPGSACYLRWLAMPELLRLSLGQVA